MIELAVVIVILGIFAFPIPASAVCLGLYTTWFSYRCYEAFKNQPLEGKKILSTARIAFFINFITSVVLSVFLALLIYVFIFDFFYLFLFNFIFCFLISIRWFDFSFRLFQRMTTGNVETNKTENKFFVIIQGFKDNSGIVMSPAFTDAGFLTVKKNKAEFEGTFFKNSFTSKTINQIDKKSFEKIKIHTYSQATKDPTIYLITLKDHFYPFRSRDNRDIIFNSLLNNSSVDHQSN